MKNNRRNERLLEEEKEYYKELLTKWIMKRIELYYKYYNNEQMPSYEQIYDSSFDILELSEKEKEDIYKNVDKRLLKERRLFMANDRRDRPIYIVAAVRREII